MIPQALTLPNSLDVLAIIVGALSGSLHATRKRMGPVGVFAVAFCTGLGGGAIRDVMLNAGIPAFLVSPNLMLYAMLGAVIGFFFAKAASKMQPAYDVLDALMMGVWVMIGCTQAFALDLSIWTAMFAGLVASTAGGMLRDLMCHDVPAVLKPGQWVGLAAAIASVLFVSLLYFGVIEIVAQVVTLAATITMRFVSIRFDLRTPMPHDVSERVLKLLRIRRKQPVPG